MCRILLPPLTHLRLLRPQSYALTSGPPRPEYKEEEGGFIGNPKRLSRRCSLFKKTGQTQSRVASSLLAHSPLPQTRCRPATPTRTSEAEALFLRSWVAKRADSRRSLHARKMRIPFPLPPSLCVSAVSQESLLSGGGHLPRERRRRDPAEIACHLVDLVVPWRRVQSGASGQQQAAPVSPRSTPQKGQTGSGDLSNLRSCRQLFAPPLPTCPVLHIRVDIQSVYILRSALVRGHRENSFALGTR